MSVQQDFFEALLEELKNKGVDDKAAEESVQQFKDRLLEKAETEEQLDAALSKIPPASIAENIFNMLKASEGDEDAGARSEVMVIDTASDTVSTEIREGHDASAPLEDAAESDAEEEAEDSVCESEKVEEESDSDPELEESGEDGSIVTDDGSEFDVEFPEDSEDTVADEKGSAEDNSYEIEPELSDEYSDESLDGIFGGEDASEESHEENVPEREFTEEEALVERYTPGAKRRIHAVSQTPPGERKTVRRTSEALDLFPDEADGRTSWLFVVLTIILAPLAAVLGVVVFAFFLLLWATLAVLITLILVGLVGLAAAGTAISLAGLIFGVIESISGHTAAGMFEIGLALIIAAIIIFCGIWLYNFAIRFLPFIIKKLGNLLVSIFKLFKKAFRKFKELCSSI